MDGLNGNQERTVGNGGRLFRRPKLTLSCNAERKEGRKEGLYGVYKSSCYILFSSVWVYFGFISITHFRSSIRYVGS
jgi:hypothetical protein